MVLIKQFCGRSPSRGQVASVSRINIVVYQFAYTLHPQSFWDHFLPFENQLPRESRANSLLRENNDCHVETERSGGETSRSTPEIEMSRCAPLRCSL